MFNLLITIVIFLGYLISLSYSFSTMKVFYFNSFELFNFYNYETGDHTLQREDIRKFNRVGN